jgi:hypothetical protein
VATIEQSTPEFMTRIVGGHRVVDVTSRQVGSGQMGRCYQLLLTYESPGGGLPTRMMAKLPSTDTGSREFATAMRAYAREVDLYRLVAPELMVRTPKCYAANVSEEGFGLSPPLGGSVAGHRVRADRRM